MVTRRKKHKLKTLKSKTLKSKQVIKVRRNKFFCDRKGLGGGIYEGHEMCGQESIIDNRIYDTPAFKAEQKKILAKEQLKEQLKEERRAKDPDLIIKEKVVKKVKEIIYEGRSVVTELNRLLGSGLWNQTIGYEVKRSDYNNLITSLTDLIDKKNKKKPSTLLKVSTFVFGNKDDDLIDYYNHKLKELEQNIKNFYFNYFTPFYILLQDLNELIKDKKNWLYYILEELNTIQDNGTHTDLYLNLNDSNSYLEEIIYIDFLNKTLFPISSKIYELLGLNMTIYNYFINYDSDSYFFDYLNLFAYYNKAYLMYIDVLTIRKPFNINILPLDNYESFSIVDYIYILNKKK